jgi:hypothetical protein
MAPQFMEMAAARFETLEGFKGEERLRDIAKGVYFTQDGKFDAPRSKQEAYERAMQFGASAKEAATISGYMVDEEDEDQYYRDDGKGGWETMRSDTDPRGNWTRGNPPASRSPSAVTTTAGPVIQQKMALLRDKRAALESAAPGSVDARTLEEEIKILRTDLHKRGTEISDFRIFSELRKIYETVFASMAGGLKGKRPSMENWLLTDKEGIYLARAFFGDTYVQKVKQGAKEHEDVESGGLPTGYPPTREAAFKIARASPTNDGFTDEEIHAKLDEFYPKRK